MQSGQDDLRLFEKRKSRFNWRHIDVREEGIEMLKNEITIVVQELKKSYNDIPVLTGVDFEVKTGSILPSSALTDQARLQSLKSLPRC